MEFPFRGGGEGTHPFFSSLISSSSSASVSTPDGYFATQAARAGIVGFDIRRDYSFSRGLSPMEIIHREMERERMREEILSNEAERMAIEEEVRQRLSMPHVGNIRHSSFDPWIIPPFGEPARVSYEYNNPSGSSRFPNTVGFKRRFPPKCKIEEITGEDNSDSPNKKQNDPVSDSVRERSKQKKAKEQTEFSCALCRVSATSEAGLREHLQGKKHRSKLAKSGLIKPEETVVESNQIKNQAKPFVGVKKISMQVEGKMHVVFRRNNLLCCDLCKFRCDNTMKMAMHLSGKKHNARIIQTAGEKSAD